MHALLAGAPDCQTASPKPLLPLLLLRHYRCHCSYCCCPCLAALAGWLQDQAEQYCESLRLNGLIVTIEPAGDGGSGGGGSGGEGGGPNTST